MLKEASTFLDLAVIADVLDITGQDLSPTLEKAGRSDNSSVIDPEVERQSATRNLYLSTLRGDLPLLRELLEQGADANGKNKLGFTPLHAAVFKGENLN